MTCPSVVRPRALPLLTDISDGLARRKGLDDVQRGPGGLELCQSRSFAGNPGCPSILCISRCRLHTPGCDCLSLEGAGTSCINLPQTHAIIQLFRAILDEVAPHVMLITETNVPHADNISYFGDGKMKLIWSTTFPFHPWCCMHFRPALQKLLSQWAENLELPSGKATFFNFLASHDGIGLNPLRGILPERQIDSLVERVRTHGGLVSLKDMPDGRQLPYELNINFFDALNDPYAGEPIETQVGRFVTAHAILLAMRGLPAIYFHSLVGSRSWREGALASGHNRTINRKKLERDDLENLLSDLDTLAARVFDRLSQLLKIRPRASSLSPLWPPGSGFCPAGDFWIAAFCHRVAGSKFCAFKMSAIERSGWKIYEFERWNYDLIETKMRNTDIPVSLKPYQSLWLVELKD